MCFVVFECVLVDLANLFSCLNSYGWRLMTTLGIIVIGTYEPPCVQMEIFVEIFVDFDGLYNNFFGEKQCKY